MFECLIFLLSMQCFCTLQAKSVSVFLLLIATQAQT
jgi:hypothetical protein